MPAIAHAVHALLLVPAAMGMTPMAQRTYTASAMSRAFSPAVDKRALASMSTMQRTGNVLVLDSADDYLSGRDIFQQLYSYGNWAKLACVTASERQAKKLLLSREARYSGLIDALQFIEAADVGSAGDALQGYDTWMVLNADESKLPAQIEAAKAAGVRRMLICVSVGSGSSSLADVAALEERLRAAGIVYTIIRTGELSNDVVGQPMRIDTIDTPSCAELSRSDAFRVCMEALTIEAAENKAFALCPGDSDETKSVFKEMRFAGANRRQEVVALIKGAVGMRQEELAKATAKAEAIKKGDVKPEVDPAVAKAKAEEDVQKAFERASERAKRVAEEEKAKEALLEEKRKERQKTQDAIDARIAEKKREGGGGGDDDDDAGPKGKKDDGKGGDDKDGGDGSKPDEPPLATL